MDRLTVLIVDDSITTRKLYNSLLLSNTDVSLDILEAEDANAGISLCETNPISCILLDYHLPDMNGLAFIKVLNSKQKTRIPIVMLTGEGNEQVAVQAMKQGVDDYIPKNNITAHMLITSIMHAINKIKLETQESKNRELEIQKKIAEEESRLKNMLLQNMSHELRTPLNGIIGYMDLMHNEDMGPLNQEQKSALSDILKSSKYLLQIINNVIELTEMSSGAIKITPQQIEVIDCINQVINNLSLIIKAKNIKVHVNVDDKVKNVYLDLDFFTKILSNYLANAIEFSRESGDVEMNIKSESLTHFRIEVVDKGCGIKSEDFPKLFVPFQLLDLSVARTHQGAGLGLALTKRMVEALGGTVEVNSHLNRGSTFSAILPKHLSD